MGPATEDDSMADATHVLVPTLGRPREDEALTYALETFPDAEITLLAVVTRWLDAPLSEGRRPRAKRGTDDGGTGQR